MKKNRKSRSDLVIKKFGSIIIFQNIKKFDKRIPHRFKRNETLDPLNPRMLEPLLSINQEKNQK